MEDGKRMLNLRQARAACDRFEELIADSTAPGQTRAVNAAEDAAVKEQKRLSESELLRQEQTKRAHTLALQALGEDCRCAESSCCSNTRTAIARCDDALAKEPGEHPDLMGEHRALVHIREACILWQSGDTSMSTWQGDQALAFYEKAQDEALAARNTPMTAGYFGSKVQLTPLAMSALANCISSANKEKRRRANFEIQIANGEGALCMHSSTI